MASSANRKKRAPEIRYETPEERARSEKAYRDWLVERAKVVVWDPKHADDLPEEDVEADNE